MGVRPGMGKREPYVPHQPSPEENWNNDLNHFAEVMSQLHEEVRKQRGVTRLRKEERMPGRR